MNTHKLAAAMLLFILAVPFCIATDNIVISEVLYDPIGTESGGEAVELYNPTNSTVDVSGWVIKTESSATDATIPTQTFLQPQQYYLIADSNWETSKDNPVWDSADHEEPITLQNTDSGIALIDTNSNIIDAVGWGDPAGIDSTLYETVPADLVTLGKSIYRSIDTDNNVMDFAETTPNLKNSTMPDQDTTTAVIIEVEVINSAPQIINTSISPDDDSFLAGIQIIPEPGDSKVITVTTTIADTDGAHTIPEVYAEIGAEIKEMAQDIQLSNISVTYSTTFLLQYYDDPGEYDITISVENTTETESFQYYAMIAIELDSSGLQFEQSGPGDTLEMLGDYALSTTDRPSIRNLGNTQIDLGIEGANLIDGTNSIPVTSMMYSFDNDFTSALSGTLSSTLQTAVLGMAKGENAVLPLGFRLNIPSNTPSGNYSSSVTVIASGS
ncbi:MAG: lamin tail domain-containing protein [Candidatus Thorarchaeota archaeon]